MSTPSPDIHEAVARRLADRYVLQADPASRAAFLGRSEHEAESGGARATSLLLHAWPKIKRIPVLGPVAYAAFRAARSLARRGGGSR